MKNNFLEILKKTITENKGFILFSLFFFCLIFTLENINGRFWLYDFKVYYLAAKSLISGNQVYGIPFGLDTGFYKYSPFTLLTFTPYCLLPYFAASCIHYAIISISTILSALVIQKIMTHYVFSITNQKKNLIMSIAIICIIRHIFRELHMGNVNIIIVMLLSSGLLLSLKNKSLLSGIFIGLAIMIKPYFILLLLPMLFHKKTKTILSVGITILFSIGITFLILGFSNSMNLHKNWLTAMLGHNSYITSNDTLQSIFNYYFNAELTNAFQLYVLISVVIIYSIFTLLSKQFKPKITILNNNEQLPFVIGYFVLFAMIPNILLTDTEHFLFSLPLILFLLNYLFISKNYLSVCIFILVIFFYSGNSSDIMGNKLADKIDKMGLLGISNILFIGFSIYVAAAFKNQELNQKKLLPK